MPNSSRAIRVALLGLGLIGGSLGQALRVAGRRWHVTGYDRREAEAALALDRGAVDALAATPALAVAGAELVILAAPVLAIRELLEAIAPSLAPGAVVSDVASTKGQVLAWAAELLPAHATFVGGHPMAGSEKSGMAAARPGLFRGAVYCITPAPGASQEAVERVTLAARAVGARPLLLAAAEHDAAVAAISHLPFLASTALVKLTASDPRWPVWGEVAATGYRDVTRLASGDPAMYRDICLTNADAIAPLLRGLAHELLAIAGSLEDRTALETLFATTRAQREAWLDSQSRFRLP